MRNGTGAEVGQEGRLAREKEFWDHAFADDARRPAAKFYALGRRRVALYHSLVALRAGPGTHMLEIGCSGGRQAMHLAELGTHVTGIDISPVAIRHANEAAVSAGVTERTRFEVMDAEALDFPDGSLDVVFGTAVIHHLDLQRVLPEIRRVLKPGGEAIFTEPLGHNPLINAYRRRTPAMRTVDEHPLLMSDLDLCKRYWGTVDIRYFHLTSLAAAPLHRKRAFAPTLRLLEMADDALLRIGPLRRYAWYVVMRLSGPRRLVARRPA